MLNRLSVQNKILATLAVPIVIILMAASIFSYQSIQNWRTAEQVRDATELIAEGQDFISILQQERHWAVEYRRQVLGAKQEWEKAVKTRTVALDQLNKSFEEQNLNLLPSEVNEALFEVKRDLRVLIEAAADQTKRRNAGTHVISESYDQAIELMLRVPEALGNTARDREVGRDTLAYVELIRYIDQMTAEIPLIGEILAVSSEVKSNLHIYRETAAEIRLANAQRDKAIRFMDRLDHVEVELPEIDPSVSSIRQSLADANTGNIPDPLRDKWASLAAAEVEELTPARDTLATAMETAASDSVQEARNSAILMILAMTATVALSLGIAYLTSKSITRPLQNLTKAADRVKTELPRLVEQVAVPGQGPDFNIEKIKVESRDEVGQLAEAFNAVNSTTIDVAKEQAALRGSIAEMFVNVARRDHVLLNRQLGFLDELERAEEDPTTLANLFRLDHLATRMRRNSESLLVLAGIDSGRRLRDSMPMSDVVRTASSEIELYERVQLDLQADPHMLGHNALNAAHLIAELLENATNFSEPNTPVEVTTSRTKTFVTVMIRDYGLGMSDTDIAEANKKVASRSASDVVGVQRVGLFVVGRLADRLGVHVAFSRPADGSTGTVATLSFPYTLFADEGSAPLPEPTDPLSRETQSATQQWIEPEAPVVSEVDLASLTDGTTNTGMPRRRVVDAAPSANQGFAPDLSETAPVPSLPSRGGTSSGLPARPGVSADFSNDSPEIVLPPLERPNVPVFEEDDMAWKPDTHLVETKKALPTRANTPSSAAPAFDVEETSTVPQEPERRSAMFSSFRSFNPNEIGGSDTVEPAVTQPVSSEAVQAANTKQPQAPVEAPVQESAASRFKPVDAHAPTQAHSAPLPPAGNLSADQHEDEGGDWAGRFANLPTRASRAREAKAVDTPAEAPQAGQNWAGGAPAAPQGQFNVPALEPEAPVESSDLRFSAYSAEETQQLPASDYSAAAEPQQPSAPTAQSQYAQRSYTGQDVRAGNNPQHPFTPLSEQAGPSAGQPAGSNAQAMPALPAFADVVADAPEGSAASLEKRGFFSRFRKKESAIEAPSAHEAVDVTSQAQAMAHQPFRQPVAAPQQNTPRVSTRPAQTQGSFTPAVPGHQSPARTSFQPEPQVGNVHQGQQQVPQQAPAAEATSFAPHVDAAPEPQTQQSYRQPESTGSWTPAGTQSAEAAPSSLSAADLPVTGQNGGSYWEPPVAFGDSSALALQSTLQEQALAELSELSAYRPNAMSTNAGGNLTRRVRTQLESPQDDPSAQKISRDAAELRARLSAFQSATARGRQDGVASAQSAQGESGSEVPMRVPDSANSR
ncbi:ATP-binding protein [Timonella sp. A28]|uniref:sensor histidine kinase n=1 Tax=Timonella sp. A28 TaxID=3442640 RepID=UPI003EB77773